ncbi:MAG: TIGR03790 family protein [Planctomycetes bacterium]|nr:TIGR03790 family protein [Planctomycetota bacterium]
MGITKTILIFILILFSAQISSALQPDEILIIVNSDISESVEIAKYYCKKRAVPKSNIISLSLGSELKDTITRKNYQEKLAKPIRKKIAVREFASRIDSEPFSAPFASPVRCLLTTYGVPFKVAERGWLNDEQKLLKELKKEEDELEGQLLLLDKNKSAAQSKAINHKLLLLRSRIDRIIGKETNASVDSELAMVMFDSYELYRWQPNTLNNKFSFWDFKTLMVSRLDGPGGFETAKGLIDKALLTEEAGLKGIAYIDCGYSIKRKGEGVFAGFDQSLKSLAAQIKRRALMQVRQEKTANVFEPDSCPDTAIYCGWYSLKKYVDAFDFASGAIGYHIASLEAVDLRNPGSSQWCPAMLQDGITATLGAVAEPYLQAFPKPNEFFAELFNGRCLVEAYCRTKPFNSWQMLLIGDPLYTPFKAEN